MRALGLDEIHKREREMLRKTAALLDAHGIPYYLCGGTLLGAVRHKGFIPWDDDVDLLMPRPAYERFLQIAGTQPFLPQYEFRSNALGNLDDPCLKLMDLGTRVEKDYLDDPNDRWLWIDIFPMDGCPESDAELAAMYRRVHRLRRILKFMKLKPGTGRSTLKKWVKPLLKGPALLLFGKKRTVRKIEKIAKTYPYEQSQTVAGIVYGYGICERMVKSSYEPRVTVEFEGLTLSAPACYDSYLRALYGEYEKLPPAEERQVHFMKVFEESERRDREEA